MQAVLLDTHVWIWLAIGQSGKLSASARMALQGARQKWIPAISLWKIAKLVEKQRLGFSIPLLTRIERALNENGIRIAVESTHLEGYHKDPADRIIVATARIAGWPLLSADEPIRACFAPSPRPKSDLKSKHEQAAAMICEIAKSPPTRHRRQCRRWQLDTLSVKTRISPQRWQ